jgi:hypothetical protein
MKFYNTATVGFQGAVALANALEVIATLYNTLKLSYDKHSTVLSATKG